MLTEQDILDLGFERETFSTDAIQYYIYVVERDDIDFDAHNDYILKVNGTEHELGSKLRLGSSYSLNTNSISKTFTDKDDLQDMLMRLIRWDQAH